MRKRWADPKYREAMRFQRQREIENNPERKAALMAARDAYWADPKNVQKQSDLAKEFMRDPERRKHLAELAARQMADPQRRDQQASLVSEMRRQGKFKESELEKIVAGLLAAIGIEFSSQARIRGYSGVPDFLLVNYSIVIEVDGEYWHSMPGVLEKDKKKDRRLRTLGYSVLHFTEKDIKRRLNLVERKLMKKIKQREVDMGRSR
jgi:very-short-patch-repair endonuclease